MSLQGPDAATFAQAQFANDLSTLAPRRWQWNAWLTPKGRVLAIFMLARLSEEELLMVLADGRAEELASQLQRFVFRRKVRIAARADLHAGGRLAPPQLPAGPAEVGVDGQDLVFDLGAPDLPRTLRLSADPHPSREGFALQWRQADLRLGLPRLDESPAEAWTPQQIGLDRLHAYSVKKGCYPGQEIVARTHFLGKAKRVAQLVQVPPGTSVGEELQVGGQAAGLIACVAGELALAVLPIDSEALPLQYGGEAVARLPLLEGLAR